MEQAASTVPPGASAADAVPRCLLCEQELRDRTGSQLCAHCGVPVAISLESAAAERGQANIESDLPCNKCGYNLRGLPRGGRCPECGTPISFLLHGNLLCLAEPGYVNKLARGSTWILRGVALCVLGAIGGFAVAVAIVVAPPLSPLDFILAALLMLAPLAMSAGMLLSLAGVWFITARQPLVFATPPRDTARRLARLYLLTALPAWALGIAIQRATPPIWAVAAAQFFGLGVSVLGVVGTVAYFLYLEGVVQRIPEQQMANSARSLAIGFGIALGMLVLLQAMQTVIVWGPALLPGRTPVPVSASGSPAAPSPALTRGWFEWTYAFAGCAALVLLIMFLLNIGLHSRLRKLLRQQVAAAKRLSGMAVAATS